MTIPAETLRYRWGALFPDGDRDRIESAFRLLDRQYSEPHRHYHTWMHIRACLGEVNLVRAFNHTRVMCDNIEVVEAALWFHDLFYDPMAVGNEKRSAVNGGNILRTLGRPELIEPVKRAIMFTRHGQIPETPDDRTVVDIDLSILGAHEDDFDEYERQIRREYGFVPEEKFRAGRLAILRGFLQRERIYATDYFRDLYEVQARANLTRSIAALEAGEGEA